MVETVKDDDFEGKILKVGTIIGKSIRGDKAIIKVKGADGKTYDFVMMKSQGKWNFSTKQ